MPTIADYRAKYPSLRDLDDNALIGRVAEVQGVDPEDVIAHMGYKPKARSLMAVANDTVIEAANATAGAVGSVANFIAPGNRVSSFIDEKIIRPGEASQSDVTQQSRRQFQQEVEQADGIGGELMAVGRKVMRDPLLTAAQAAGSFVIPGMAVKAAGGAAGALGAGAAGVSRAGLAGGATAGAALSGGDAAGTAYDLVIKAGGSEQEAVAAARQASVLPAAVGGLGGMVGAERLLAGAGGVKGSIMARAFKTAGIEGVQEGVEEGITQYEGQRAAMPFDSAIDPWKGVGAAAGMGAVMGGGIGGVAGALSANPADAQRRDEAERRLATAPDVGSMVQAATDLAMTPLTPPVRPRAAGADAMAEIRQLDPADQQEAIGLLGAANNQNAPGNVRRYSQNRLDELLLPVRQGPIGDATELDPALPVGDATELDAGALSERLGRPSFTQQRMLERGIPAGEASDLISTGDAVEQLDSLPNGDAAEIDPEVIQADDFRTGDDMPYGTQSGAAVRARREGLTPAEVVKVAGGWVVRPQPTALGTAVDGRPNNTRGTTAADVLGGRREPVADVPRTAGVAAGAADERAPTGLGGGGNLRPLLDGDRGSDAAAQAPAPGSGAVALAGSGNAADQALTAGARVDFDGKTWTVIDASPSMIRLEDGQGTRRAISSTSAKWQQVTATAEQGAADAPSTASTPGSEALAPAAATVAPAAAAGPAGGAVEADGLSATTELLDKLAAGFDYQAFNAMPEGLGKTARKLGDAIMGRDAASMADILGPSNKRSRAAFESLFSGKVKLPSTINGTRAVIDDFLSKVSAGINAAGPVAAAQAQADVSQEGEKTNTSAERVQETPESEQVAPLKDRVDAKRKPVSDELAQAKTALRTAMSEIDAANAEWASIQREAGAYFTGDGPSRKLSPNAPDAIKARYEAFKAAKKGLQKAYDEASARVTELTPQRAEPQADAPAAAPEVVPETATPKPRQLNGSDTKKAEALFAKPEPKPKRQPKSFRKKHQVWTSVFVEESGKFEQRETDADTALKALDEDVAEMTAFRKCLTGG